MLFSPQVKTNGQQCVHFMVEKILSIEKILTHILFEQITMHQLHFSEALLFEENTISRFNEVNNRVYNNNTKLLLKILFCRVK